MRNDMKIHAFPKANAKVSVFWGIFQVLSKKRGKRDFDAELHEAEFPDGGRRDAPEAGP
jgi:hypothetical protein